MVKVQKQRYQFFYGWMVVLVCFTIISLVFGIRLTFGLFFEALTRANESGVQEFDWTRSSTAGAFSVTMVIFALTSMPIGWLLDRWGPRLVFSLGLIIVSTGLVMSSRMTTLFHFYLYYGVWTGFGITVLGLSMHATTISRWFDRLGRRGLAIGIAFSGTGVGIFFLAPLVERTITFYGWRNAYIFLGCLLLIVGLPAVFFLLRNEPHELGLEPDGILPKLEQNRLNTDNVLEKKVATLSSSQKRLLTDESVVINASLSQKWTFYDALRTPVFWFLMISGACSLFTLRMVSVHQIAHLVDNGITRLVAATVLGGAGVITALAFIGFGVLSDRIGRANTFYLGSIAQISALYILIQLPVNGPIFLLYLYALLWGIGEGGRSGLLTAITSDTFPGPSMGTIIGTMGGFFGIGSALGSWLAGYIYDLSGSYTLPFEIAAVATLVSTGCIYIVQRLQMNLLDTKSLIE